MTTESMTDTSILETGSPAVKAPLKRRLSRQVAADTVAIGDLLSVALGGLLPAMIYAVVGHVHLDQILLVQSTLIAGFISHLCLRFRGLYDTARMDNFPQAPLELLVAVACGMIGVLGIGLPLALHNLHLVVWYSAWLSASYTMILLNRMVAGKILAQLADAGRFDERVAVFGAGQIARRVRDYLTTPGLGIHFAGVFDDRAGQDRLDADGLTVNGRLDDLIADCREGRIDRIVVALPQQADHRISTIVAQFDRLPVSTHIVTHISSDLVGADIAHNVSSLGPVGLLDVKKKR